MLASKRSWQQTIHYLNSCAMRFATYETLARFAGTAAVSINKQENAEEIFLKMKNGESESLGLGLNSV